MLTFAQPLFLLALLGLALPLIAHLVNRTRATPRRFPSIRFIQVSQLPRDKRRSLRDILLLLMRLGLLALIILALAQPQWTPEPGAALPPGVPKTVIVVDASASMDGWDAWEQARAAVEELTKDEAAFGFVLFDQEVLAAEPLGDNAGALRMLMQDHQPELLSGNPSDALRQARELLGDSGARRLAIVSDFQATTWQDAALPGFDDEVEILFQAVGDYSQGNLSLLEANVYPVGGDQLRILARLRNDSTETVETPLRLTAGSNTQTQEVTLAPGQVQTVGFLSEVPESLQGELSLPEDAFLPDNTFYLWMSPPLPAQVVALLPTSSEPEKLDEVAFVQKALEASSQERPAVFSLSGAAPGFDLAGSAEALDVLYLPAVATYLDETELAEVKAYVEAGGVALITPGKSPARMFRNLREAGLTDSAFLGQPGRHREQVTPFRLAALGDGNPLSGVFSGEPERDLALTSVYSYVKLRPGEAAEVLLATEDGDPILLRQRLGEGQLVISTMGLDTSWSDLPLRNAYLPILREVLSQAVQDDDVLRLDVGAPLPTGVNVGPGQVPALITAEPGIELLANKVAQINTSRREASNVRVNLNDLRAQLKRGEAGAPSVAQPAVATAAIQLWDRFALLALLFIFLESLMAAPASRKRKANRA
ncbi:MAG: VWA domain-containing protein [Verrucomicrobiota bacterium]